MYLFSMGNKVLYYPNWQIKNKQKKKIMKNYDVISSLDTIYIYPVSLYEQTNMQKVDKIQRILHLLNLYL